MHVEHRTGGRRELLWIALIALFGLATLVLLLVPGVLGA
ncbi:hypothetical protein M2284_004607 [Rhodococcus sp. LBL1]|uniref:Uncharacterized protein n=1 Tax=Prescottella agglutinans TaxID=1644129 RepID=A0ABT6M3T2_9NOCA|nr:hypothetical protein [Prescottella agglutinans]MDH6680378.1 hypothetical protein [Rhodococcus sp. LBL1]MDH6685807.1 hypothetical protein [Rhodococcus sp. LBL2]